MVRAICLEIKVRSSYINEKINTIYFGGGTPSILEPGDLNQILDTIKTWGEVSSSAEVTLEANPEDLDSQKLRGIMETGINRLSIGFQTSSNQQLKWMNRIHSSEEAVSAFEKAREIGFDNISVDLIYALPNHSMAAWLQDLHHVSNLNPEHVSIYGLTVEEKTVFGKQRRTGQLVEVPEETAADQYLKTIEQLQSKGYNQYEVSNFSKPGYESRHNSSYWAGVPYLGVGPGAHSYNGSSRQFNVRNNAKYLKALASGEPHYESEELSQTQVVNERILTGLRTSKGINIEKFETDFNIKLLEQREMNIRQFEQQGFLVVNEKQLRLTATGFLVADEIALKLFFDE